MGPWWDENNEEEEVRKGGRVSGKGNEVNRGHKSGGRVLTRLNPLLSSLIRHGADVGKLFMLAPPRASSPSYFYHRMSCKGGISPALFRSLSASILCWKNSVKTTSIATALHFTFGTLCSSRLELDRWSMWVLMRTRIWLQMKSRQLWPPLSDLHWRLYVACILKGMWEKSASYIYIYKFIHSFRLPIGTFYMNRKWCRNERISGAGGCSLK